MIRRCVIPTLMTIDFFFIIGFGGSYENDAITTAQFIQIIIICFLIFIFLDYLRTTKIKAFRGWHHKKATRK